MNRFLRVRYGQTRQDRIAEIAWTILGDMCGVLLAIACGLLLSLFLTGCGGGDCDDDCHATLDQAHGVRSIEPVTCSASAVCH